MPKSGLTVSIGNHPKVQRSPNTRQSVRLIALLEATKGALVLLVGFSLLELVHHNLQGTAEEIVRHFHLNPASQYPRIFIDTASRLNDINLWLLSAAAGSYAALRLVEAFGLWHQRRWAEWLGTASGGMYIPIELYELLHGVSWPKLMLLGINVLCVAFLIQALRTHSTFEKIGPA